MGDKEAVVWLWVVIDEWVGHAKSIVGHDLCAAVEAQHVLEPVDPIVQVGDRILEFFCGVAEILAA